MTVHRIHGVDVNIAGGSGSDLAISQLQNSSIDLGTGVIELAGGSRADASMTTIDEVAPVGSLTSSMIAAILGICGINGLEIVSDVDELGVQLEFGRIDPGTAALESGDVHLRGTIGNGLMYPTNISADLTPAATISLDIVAVSSDGDTAPISLTATGSAGTYADVAEAFVCGPGKVNGVDIGGVLSLNIDFGITIEKRRADGDKYATEVWIITRRPRITIQASNVEIFNTIGVDGVPISSSTIFYLKKTSTAGRQADNSGEHISFAVNEGHVFAGPLTGAQESVVGTEIVIVPSFDGTNGIIVIDPAANIV